MGGTCERVVCFQSSICVLVCLFTCNVVSQSLLGGSSERLLLLLVSNTPCWVQVNIGYY